MGDDVRDDDSVWLNAGVDYAYRRVDKLFSIPQDALTAEHHRQMIRISAP
ncbi:hypothetical protein [Microbacterium sp. NPDC055665]